MLSAHCMPSTLKALYYFANFKLEQLERLRSKDAPRRPVITHTIDQFVLIPKSILFINLTRNTPINSSDYLWQIWK